MIYDDRLKREIERNIMKKVLGLTLVVWALILVLASCEKTEQGGIAKTTPATTTTTTTNTVTTLLTTTTTSISTSESQDIDIAPPEDDKYSEGLEFTINSDTTSIDKIWEKLKSDWNSAKTWWKNNVGGLTTKLNISVPKLTVNWGEVSALGKTFKYHKSFSVKFAADGGIFDAGSLIWAGERGAEIALMQAVAKQVS